MRPLALAVLSLLAACQQPQSQGNEPVPAAEPETQLPAATRPEPLDRSAILAAAAQAASAHAVGADDSAEQRALDGRQFELRIRFGCEGPSAELREQWLGWSFDEEKGTLRVRAKPTLTREEPLVQKLGGSGFEAVEGFWIPRPWLIMALCPATAAVEPASTGGSAVSNPEVETPASRGPRIGIAQFFSETDPRTGRRALRPYEAVKTLKSGSAAPLQGFDLVLSGRLKGLPDKRVIACSATGMESPPDCVISADFDRVWIEAAGNAEVVAEWSSG